MLNLIPFEERKRQSHKKKELWAILFVGSIFLSTIFYYSYVHASPILTSKLPFINISCLDEIDKDDFVECTIELENEEPIKAKIRFRGTSVTKYPKKGYRIELSEEKSLLNLRKDDDWLLFALYRDHRRMKLKFSMDLWRTLEDTNPTCVLPKSRYIKLFLNGEFQGLYLLSEKIDRSLFGLDDAQNNIDTSLIFQVKYWTELNEYEKSAWEQDWPNQNQDNLIMDEILPDLLDFINNTSDETFFNPSIGIYSKFNKLNLIDFYIYNFFLIHKDFWSKNYYLVRNSNPDKFYLIPWDFDNIIEGRWSLHDTNLNRESEIQEKNELYNRLIGNKEFMQACKERWLYLRANLWTDHFILDMIYELYEEIEDILELELEMWTPNSLKREPYDLDEHVNELFEWFPERLAFCDSYFAKY